MAISVTIAGTTYSVPTVGEVGWGASCTALLRALASAVGAATTSVLGTVKLSRAPASAASPIVIASTGGTITATTSSGNTGLVATGDGAGHGVDATGGATGTGVVGRATTLRGVNGIATSGQGVRGDATTGLAVHGNASGAGTGGYFTSASGYAVVCEGDTTSPVKAAFRLIPQDAEPTGPNAVGDIYCTAAGVLKICTVAGTPGTFVSVGAQ